MKKNSYKVKNGKKCETSKNAKMLYIQKNGKNVEAKQARKKEKK